MDTINASLEMRIPLDTIKKKFGWKVHWMRWRIIPD